MHLNTFTIMQLCVAEYIAKSRHVLNETPLSFQSWHAHREFSFSHSSSSSAGNSSSKSERKGAWYSSQAIQQTNAIKATTTTPAIHHHIARSPPCIHTRKWLTCVKSYQITCFLAMKIHQATSNHDHQSGYAQSLDPCKTALGRHYLAQEHP